MYPYPRTPVGQQATAAADARAPPPPQANVAWTPPAGQPPPPDDSPPEYPAPQPIPSEREDQPSATPTRTQPPPPLGPPPPRQPTPPRATSIHADLGHGDAERVRRSWPDDDMDLDDAGTPSPRQGPAHAASHRGGSGADDVVALPSQPRPPREIPAPAGPPPLPPPQLPPPMVPTMSLAPAAPAPPIPQQQVFAPPVFNPPAYAHAGAATAAATAAPVVIATSAPGFHRVPAGVVVGRSLPPGASTAGTAPVSVMLPLGSVARPPIITTVAPSFPTTPAGLPQFTPQQLDAALVRQAKEMLAVRRQNPPVAPAPLAPPVPPALAYIPENHLQHPGNQPFQPGGDQHHELQGSHDRDGSLRQLHGSPPPPFSW